MTINEFFRVNTQKKIGSGAFGVIYPGNILCYLGINTKLNEEVAVKLVTFLLTAGTYESCASSGVQ